ncbi:MAG: hypothetical protein AAF204_00650, partial [Pseudomonadota bacterium]
MAENLKYFLKRLFLTIRKSDKANIAFIVSVLALLIAILSHCEMKESNLSTSEYQLQNLELQSKHLNSMEKLIAKIEPLTSKDFKEKLSLSVPIPLKKPSSPDHKKQGKILAACLMLAAQTYFVPPAILVGIYKMEEGVAGKKYGPLDDQTHDLGPMRINSSEVPLYAEKWGVSEEQATEWIQNDICTNVGVAA